RKALADSGRENITLSIEEVSAFTLGLLVGLFERAVGFYATLVNINAYHQPGVEAGKKAATDFLKRLAQVRAALGSAKAPVSAAEVAGPLGIDAEDAFHMLVHLAANGGAKAVSAAASPAEARFTAS
ncbi:MAG: glucose-6-phosphate isomerase, partial [Prosthecobacter sp.]